MTGNPKTSAIRVPALDLPMSPYVSRDSRSAVAETLQRGFEPQEPYSRESIGAIRAAIYDGLQRSVDTLLELYPVSIRRSNIAGVPVSIVEPLNAQSQHDHLLIEMHPGGYVVGAGFGLLEAIPIAFLTGMKVVAVEYRLAPEQVFPAPLEDLQAVYTAVLAENDAKAIGLFGSSGGGLLAAQTIEWFDRAGLPRPGALGILASGADARFDGDSRHFWPPSGHGVDPSKDIIAFMMESYFGGVDLNDALVSPVHSLEILSKFPPTLVLTSTRAHDLSSAVFTHGQLVRAGVCAELHVWDGMPHNFHLQPEISEARQALGVVAEFFKTHLAAKGPGRPRRASSTGDNLDSDLLSARTRGPAAGATRTPRE